MSRIRLFTFRSDKRSAACAIAILLLVVGLPLPAPVHAQAFREMIFGKVDPNWKEGEVKLPPYPKTANLIPFEAPSTNNARFFIDPESISVGDDGVVRYTLVTKNPGGAQNIFFEGMHCINFQQKSYAFGRSDGTWAEARNSEWRPMEPASEPSVHTTLFLDYFCPGRILPIASAAEAINRFKHGVPFPLGNMDADH